MESPLVFLLPSAVDSSPATAEEAVCACKRRLCVPTLRTQLAVSDRSPLRLGTQSGRLQACRAPGPGAETLAVAWAAARLLLAQASLWWRHAALRCSGEEAV